MLLKVSILLLAYHQPCVCVCAVCVRTSERACVRCGSLNQPELQRSNRNVNFSVPDSVGPKLFDRVRRRFHSIAPFARACHFDFLPYDDHQFTTALFQAAVARRNTISRRQNHQKDVKRGSFVAFSAIFYFTSLLHDEWSIRFLSGQHARTQE